MSKERNKIIGRVEVNRRLVIPRTINNGCDMTRGEGTEVI